MMFTQVVLFASVVMGSAYAAGGYGESGGMYRRGPSSEGVGFPYYDGGAGRRQGQNEAPKPYNFNYNADDGRGNVHYRNEQSDQNGRVKGTYGYSDAQGLYRVVEYTADENGFRANIRTNEPGVDGKESPADVVLNAEQPPSGIQGAGPFGAFRPYDGGARGIGGGYGSGRRGPGKPEPPYYQNQGGDTRR